MLNTHLDTLKTWKHRKMQFRTNEHQLWESVWHVHIKCQMLARGSDLVMIIGSFKHQTSKQMLRVQKETLRWFLCGCNDSFTLLGHNVAIRLSLPQKSLTFFPLFKSPGTALFGGSGRLIVITFSSCTKWERSNNDIVVKRVEELGVCKCAK